MKYILMITAEYDRQMSNTKAQDLLSWFCLYHFILITLVMLIHQDLLAQTENFGVIRGIVVDDSTKSPLESVDAILHRKGDSTIVMGIATNSNGRFEFTRVPWDEYFVRLRLVGHKQKATPTFVIDPHHRRLNLGKIPLRPTVLSLDEVTVTAEAPRLTFSTDRMIYNVGHDVLNGTASVSELLEDVPSVQVDIDGEVSLRGSTRVLLMINGRRSPVLDRQEGTFLDELPADLVERIEVITTPSAKYKGAGKSGIINIVLKEEISLGTHGTLSANAGTMSRYNGNVRLNYGPGNLGAYGSYALKRSYRNRFLSDVRAESTITLPHMFSSNYRDNVSSTWRPLTHLVTLGADYRFDELNSAGITTTYFESRFTRDDFSGKALVNNANIPTRVYDRYGSGYEFDKEHSISANFQHVFSKRDHKLQLDFAYSGSPETNDYRFTNVNQVPALPTSFDNSRIKLYDSKKQISVDYSLPLSDVSDVEAGYVGEFNHNILDFYAEKFDSVQHLYVPDTASDRISSYGLTESIHSLYVTYQQTVGDFGVLGGLRVERDFRESNLQLLDSLISNRYLDLLPSVHLTYTLGKATRMSLSYSRRVSRPKPKELNPFKEYRDPKNVSYGNPLLLPEYTHSIELGCQYHKGSLFVLPSLFYRYTSNDISSIKEFVNRSTLVTREHNVSSQRSAGLEVISWWRAGKFFTVHLSTTGFYEKVDARNIGNGQFKSKLSWNGTVTFNLNFTKQSRMEIHSHFNSLRLTPQGERRPSSVVNVGFTQRLFGSRVSLVATISDVFNTVKRQSELNIPRLHQTVVGTRDSRIAYLGFRYWFGSTPRKEKDEELQYEDEE